MLSRRTQTNEPRRCATLLPALAAIPGPLSPSAARPLLPGAPPLALLDLNPPPQAGGPPEVRDDEDMRWLRCLIWPEETHRFGLLAAAVAIARAAPPRVVRGNLLTDLRALAGEAPAGATLVVYHSAVLAYLSEAERLAFRAELARIAAERPTVWLSNEGPGVVVESPVRPKRGAFVLARDGRPLALTGAHGGWIDWLR